MRAAEIQIHIRGQPHEPVVLVQPPRIAPVLPLAKGGLPGRQLQIRQQRPFGQPQLPVGGVDVFHRLGIVGSLLQRRGQRPLGIPDLQVQQRRRIQLERRFQRQPQQMRELLEPDRQPGAAGFQPRRRLASLQIHPQHLRAGAAALLLAGIGQRPQPVHPFRKCFVALNLVAQVDQFLVEIHDPDHQGRPVPFPRPARRLQRFTGSHDRFVVHQRPEIPKQGLRHLHPHFVAALQRSALHVDLPRRRARLHPGPVGPRRLRPQSRVPLPRVVPRPGIALGHHAESPSRFPRLLHAQPRALQIQRPLHQVAVVRQRLLNGLLQRQGHRIPHGFLRRQRARRQPRHQPRASLESSPHAAHLTGFPHRGKIFSTPWKIPSRTPPTSAIASTPPGG